MTASEHAENATHCKALASEQEFVDSAYQNLDQQIQHYEQKLAGIRRGGAQGTPGARSERDSFATHYENNLLRLRNVEHRLVLGRLDFHTAPAIHIGRTTLRDHQQNIVLTDWRAPQSEPFYQATSQHRMDVIRRRHIQTRMRKVINVEDELLADSNTDTSALNLTGEGALFAAMNKARDGKMGDIVATIQAEQDQIIRSSAKGILVVQGGPGTGKTAVALHRAAYLLYTYRKQFAHSGVLIIGPSKRFLQYIDQVLPSLGESDVVACTIDELFPGVIPTITESLTVTKIKSDEIWAKIAARAVREVLQKPLRKTISFNVSGTKILLTPADVEAAQARARRSGKTHNEAWEKYAQQLVELLAQRLAAAREVNLADDDWIISDIASDPEIRRAVNLHWLPASPQWLLAHILKWPEILARIAPELSPAQREALQREKDSGFSAADIPLLDELAQYLGPFESASQRATRLASSAQNAQTSEYISQTMNSLNLGEGIINSQTLHERLSAASDHASLAEKALNDRTWTYGHIVIDEAQELTAMQWRMVARRNPRRSMTIVGDLDQRRTGAPTGGWSETLRRLADNLEIKRLTISYRTPRSILDAAATKMREIGSPVSPVKAVRDIPGAYQESEITTHDFARKLTQIAAAKIADLTREYGPGYGTLAIIAPDSLLSRVMATFSNELDHELKNAFSTGQISVINARTAKGLEFDAVIMLAPEQILAGGSGDLYVAMTRATKSMQVLEIVNSPQ
ncbi:HelD family protein [Arcanobacterium hippocoleae]|uniref:DNA helicase IV n=1 Tax=Arcanobacterium hippocoleae TaxID=149017 RepID=A0ABU1T2C0_9ACTO|nr:AAA family ATPase [Arcanobacterium hippocoleae]MDR6939015.1 DNA helicase IV [Arcanobacterium hippocoleae]